MEHSLHYKHAEVPNWDGKAFATLDPQELRQA